MKRQYMHAHVTVSALSFFFFFDIFFMPLLEEMEETVKSI